MKKIPVILDTCNVPKHICCHLFGKNHSNAHRLLVGGVVILVGALATHIECHYAAVKLIAEVIGWSCHGFGLHPYIETVINHE